MIMSLFPMKFLSRTAPFILFPSLLSGFWIRQIIINKHFWFACMKSTLDGQSFKGNSGWEGE